jgi:tetraacyldisaccharide 4'-kinase
MRWLLAPAAAAYKHATLARTALYSHGVLNTHKLNRPVISIGNLSAGGTGKTPLVALVADLMVKRELKPAILTRGYRRQRGPQLIALAPEALRHADPRNTGDEPALLAKLLPEVPIVICADRYQGGLFAEHEFEVDAHILDDGFQHLQLARDLDVVTVDTTQDFSDRAVLPAGYLREPCRALARADIVVLTRCELGNANHLEKAVRGIHPSARVFRSRTGLAALSQITSGQRIAVEDLHGRRVFAFCAVGNPSAFFGNLEGWGFQIAGSRAFPDHHVYTNAETTRLQRQAVQANAAVMVTTEKDLMNLPADWTPALDLYTCLTELQIENFAALEESVLSICNRTRV